MTTQPDPQAEHVEVDAAQAPEDEADLTTDDDAQRDDIPGTSAPTD